MGNSIPGTTYITADDGGGHAKLLGIKDSTLNLEPVTVDDIDIDTGKWPSNMSVGVNWSISASINMKDQCDVYEALLQSIIDMVPVPIRHVNPGTGRSWEGLGWAKVSESSSAKQLQTASVEFTPKGELRYTKS